MKKIIAMAAAAALLLLAGCSKEDSGAEAASFDKIQVEMTFKCDEGMAEVYDVTLNYNKLDGTKCSSEVFTEQQNIRFTGKTLPSTFTYGFEFKTKDNLTKDKYSLTLDYKIEVKALDTDGNVLAAQSRTSGFAVTGINASMVSRFDGSDEADTFRIFRDSDTGAVTITRDSDLDE